MPAMGQRCSIIRVRVGWCECPSLAEPGLTIDVHVVLRLVDVRLVLVGLGGQQIRIDVGPVIVGHYFGLVMSMIRVGVKVRTVMVILMRGVHLALALACVVGRCCKGCDVKR